MTRARAVSSRGNSSPPTQPSGFTRAGARSTGLGVYFCDPHTPGQRGTNQNTNGLLRQYFGQGTDLSRWSLDDLYTVATALHERPRKTLDVRTPAEALNDSYCQHLRQV